MKRRTTDWIVIHMAHSRDAAEQIEQRLTDEGCWVRLRAVGSDEQLFEILALPSEARQAQQIIMRMQL